MEDPKKLKQVIKDAKLVAADQLDKVFLDSQKQKQDFITYLFAKNLIPEVSLYETLANYYHVPFIDLRGQTIRKDILTLIPEPIVQTQQVVAFDRDERELKVGVLDPHNLQLFDFVKKKTGVPLKVYLTTPSSIKEVITQYHKGMSAEFKKITEEKVGQAVMDEKDLKELAQDLPIVRIVDSILEYAIFENASDIHIEPTDKDLLVRYRIDGVLRDVMDLPKSTQPGLTARIKILAHLKIDEHRIPQDGRIKITTSDYKISFRVSTIPVYDGEKIVLRLLNESAKPLTLEQVGLQLGALTRVERSIKKPQGIIFITGPTGSGKTTTLYTVLNILNVPEVNIVTIEDPIEYRMPRVNQSQVNPRIGYTFANGLRSLLRQDPNIIMVGEIRDNETAEIAIHSAMTGHLVLTSLHTNDAVTTLPRLEEMGIPPFLIVATTNVVAAQRLVRKICLHCIQSYTLTKKAIDDLRKEFDLDSILSVLEKQGVILSAKTPLESLLFYRGKGCKQCSNSGYKGRIGIFEVLEITKSMAQLILERASAAQMKELAVKEGMLTMLQDGFIKAKNGITTIEEVLRVTKE